MTQNRRKSERRKRSRKDREPNAVNRRGRGKMEGDAPPAGINRVHSYMEIMMEREPEDFGDFLKVLKGGIAGEGPDSPFDPKPLDFAAGQPDCFFEGEGLIPYRGQDAAKKRLSLYIKALRERDRIKT